MIVVVGTLFIGGSIAIAQEQEGKSASQCVAMTRWETSRLSNIVWGHLRPRPGVAVWTDDYCNLVGALRFTKPD